ncbi:MAG: SH3 domain-containing protein [Holophaga sp.]|nr:SH3 domain-containing protein [Holophaga sp.]
MRFLIPFLPLCLALGGAPSRLFHLEPYQAMAEPWLTATGDQALFPAPFQTRKAAAFQRAYLGPWDPDFVAGHLTPQVAGLEARVLADLQREIVAHTGFGPNLRPWGPGWIRRIQAQLPPTVEVPFRFRAGHRAVVTENALVRLLPSQDLFLQNPELPGQGYPFDQLQNSVLWAGTPVYLLAETRDRRWCKVLAADCAGWIRTPSLTRAGAGFVRRWRGAVRRHGLVAAIRTETPVLDTRGRFHFHAYVGSVFPRRAAGGPRPAILIPGRDPASLHAVCTKAFLEPRCGVPQPWPYTPRHAAALWHTLLGRPYGWGNLQFHNDCSAELKSFFAPFGLWLPRNSTDQRDAGRSVDLSGLGLQERLAALIRVGQPYRSLVWIQGHVMLYLGPLQYTAADGETAAGFMTYQNMWGLRPRDLPDYRAIIGGSVLFPVLERYPEAPGLQSLAERARLVVTDLGDDGGDS